MNKPELDTTHFTPEQAKAISEYGNSLLDYLVKNIDSWIYNEVLPHTINSDTEYYGSDPIHKRKLSAV